MVRDSHTRSDTYTLVVLSVLFLSFYVLGALFPDTWWTTHFIAFLPPLWQYGFLLAATGLMLYAFLQRNESRLPWWEAISMEHGIWIIPVIALLAALLMFNFPIAHDYYGDAYKVLGRLDQSITEVPEGAREALFSYGLSPWDGHSTVLSIITYIAYYAEIPYGRAYLWLDVVCGFFFVLAWLIFVRYYFSSATWRLIMALAGISAPFMLIYFGHIESYAPPFLFFTLWLMALLGYLKSKSRFILWSLIPLLLVSIKLHPISLLFVPAMGLAFIHHYADPKSWMFRLLSWRGVVLWLLLPVTIAGVVLYFFIFKDHVDPRDLNERAMAFDRLFLPLFSPDPPLDKYNMLSFNHIFDYFCESLLWSPIALFLILATLTTHRQQLAWQTTPVLVTGMTLLLFGGLLFVINPLLSMQMDWDLMAIPAPALLFFTAVLVKQVEEADLGRRVFPVCLAIVLVTLPNFIVHASTISSSQRLESLGVRIYHTYYEWSSKVIEYALDIPEYDRQTYFRRKQQVLQKLEPYALPNVDFEFARMLIVEGKYFLRKEKNPRKAMAYLNEAYTYFPRERNGLLYLMESHFLLKEYAKAFEYSQQLIAEKYPSEDKAIAIALQCALEAELYDEALRLSSYYISMWDDRQVIREVYKRLNDRDQIETLKFLFSRPED